MILISLVFENKRRKLSWHRQLVRKVQSEAKHPENVIYCDRIGGNNLFEQGDLVIVEKRTWSGINKPGGVGRVLKVYKSKHICSLMKS